MKCLSKRGKFDAYWLDRGGVNMINQIMLSDDNQTELQGLLHGKSITKKIDKQIDFEQVRNQKDSFYSILLFTGYLNPTLIERDSTQPRN